MKIGDENIERIVFESTTALLKRYGKSWNMDDLAKECGMSKRTLYKIIGNKEDLLYKCHSDLLISNIKILDKFINQPLDYTELLDGLPNIIIGGINDMIIINAGFIKTEYPRIGQMIDEKVNEKRNLLLQFLDKGIREGYLIDNVTSKTISNIIDALMEFHINHSLNSIEFEAKIKDGLSFLTLAIRK